jgi:hypothetical protein
MALHRIIELYTEWFSGCSNTTSTFRTIAIFENFVKQNDSCKTYRYIHDPLLYLTSFV